ncbi:type II toxin-antitoxin system RelE/ParE family toxin [Candidatus Woesearchaeota archaeon]|nr:type II toxin-antitoxin system RelE/ParE family toxin [Candidatus Woesearchaeota archaeon]
MYFLCISPFLMAKLEKLAQKNQLAVEIILKKTDEIVINPNRYKNLRAPLNKWKRVHIGKNYVLVFSVDEKNKTVVLEDFDHHDSIYKL